MNGRAEVSRLRQRLDATLTRIGDKADDLELQSDLSRYLCVLVSGYLERAIAELVLEHARKTGGPSLQRFVESRTRRFTNPKTQKIQELLGSFDPDWRIDLETYIIDERKDAVDSIVDLRNKIAHGQPVGVTYRRVADYLDRIQDVVDRIADLCAPR